MKFTRCSPGAGAVLAMLTCLLAPGLALSAETAAAPRMNSAQRLVALAALPDWDGVWRPEQPGEITPPHSGPGARPAPHTGQSAERDTAERFCTYGVPRLLIAAMPFRLIVTPEETLMYFGSRELRHLWTDGRTHPPEDETWPYYWGESVGRWNGGVLEVHTIAMKGGHWINAAGARLSDQAELRERISSAGADRLRIEVTLTDPEQPGRSWRFARYYRRDRTAALEETECAYSAGAAARSTL